MKIYILHLLFTLFSLSHTLVGCFFLWGGLMARHFGGVVVRHQTPTEAAAEINVQRPLRRATSRLSLQGGTGVGGV